MRVVVLSQQPQPVLDGLLRKLPGCDPVAVPGPDRVAGVLLGDAVVLLDLRTPAEGREAAWALRDQGIRNGIVLVGSEDVGGLDGVVGLQPPFRLGELAAALQRARGHQPDLDVVVWSQQPGLVLDVLRTKLPGCAPVAVSGVDEVAAAMGDAAVLLLDLGDADEGRVAARALRDRGVPNGVVLIGSEDVNGLDGVVGLQPPFRLGELATALERARSDLAGPAAAEDVAQDAGDSAGEPEPSASPSASVSEDGGEGLGAAPPAPWSGRDRGEPTPTVRATIDRWRRRLRGHPGVQHGAPPAELHERLVAIFAATSKIEAIAEDLPIVTDLPSLYQAIATSVAAELEADTVGVWRPTEEGWVAGAHHGFTYRESRLPVSFDQPGMAQVDTSGAILLDRVAKFQATAAGIGGAHTNSFMATSMAVGVNRVGILTVGRDEPLVEADLEQLVELAVEAAASIAVSEHIARMAALVERMNGAPDGGAGFGPDGEVAMHEVSEAWQSAGGAFEPPAERADGQGRADEGVADEGAEQGSGTP